MLVDEPTNIPNLYLYLFSIFLDQESISGPAQRLYTISLYALAFISADLHA